MYLPISSLCGTCGTCGRREKESRRLLLRFGDGRLASAELMGLSAAADVAVLKLQGTQAKPLRFNDTLPRQGDQVSVCGMTQHGLEAVSLSGHVSQPRQRFRGLGEDPATRFVQLALPTLPGMSGSPVLDKDGKVVAMVAKKFEEHGLAIPATRVRQVAECLEAGHPWRLPMLGLEVQAAGTLAAPAVLVKALKPGSAAGAAGVEVGDVIVAIDDTPVASLLDMREALLARGDARFPAQLRLRLRRSEATLELLVETPRG
ncbi:unnamed protein product [Effrenium voratum]|uniref:PDZ domain-containing protein n=1 Tax=Effrenium voratum TaxID=2562239 RepID=A0AA36MGV0_9DINO|nr:unnamed protein product [Effrenium voratum]CAJ1413705.1 unnamed protein product [Effrenium voratum]